MINWIDTHIVEAVEFILSSMSRAWIGIEVSALLASAGIHLKFGFSPSFDKVKFRGPYAKRVFHQEFFTSQGNAVSVFYAGKDIPDSDAKRKEWLNYQG